MDGIWVYPLHAGMLTTLFLKLFQSFLVLKRWKVNKYEIDDFYGILPKSGFQVAPVQVKIGKSEIM